MSSPLSLETSLLGELHHPASTPSPLSSLFYHALLALRIFKVSKLEREHKQAGDRSPFLSEVKKRHSRPQVPQCPHMTAWGKNSFVDYNAKYPPTSLAIDSLS